MIVSTACWRTCSTSTTRNIQSRSRPLIRHTSRQLWRVCWGGRTNWCDPDGLRQQLQSRWRLVTPSDNSKAQSCVDVIADAKTMWTKVRQVTGRSKATNTVCNSANITAESLDDYYAAISDDVNYSASCVKSTVNNQNAVNHITEWGMFKLLDTLTLTAMGLDNIPAWFLQIGASFFSALVSDMMNQSLSSSTVPKQWRQPQYCQYPKYRLHSLPPTTDPNPSLQFSPDCWNTL